jgi:hypothetical protein
VLWFIDIINNTKQYQPPVVSAKDTAIISFVGRNLKWSKVAFRDSAFLGPNEEHGLIFESITALISVPRKKAHAPD